MKESGGNVGRREWRQRNDGEKNCCYELVGG